MIFPLSVSSLNEANQLIHYNNQPAVVKQCFTNIAAIQNMEYYGKFEPTESMGGYYWYVKILQCGYMEHGLKYIVFYVQKHIGFRVALS